jgi:hypothetical protein
MSEDRKAFITASNDEVWNQGNIDAAARLFAPNIVRHQPPMPDVVGLDAVTQGRRWPSKVSASGAGKTAAWWRIGRTTTIWD